MIPTLTFFVAAAALASAHAHQQAENTAPVLEYVTRFDFRKPAFVTLVPNPLDATQSDLLVSSFGVSVFGPSPDRVSLIPNAAQALKTNNFTAAQIGRSVTWPNEVHMFDNDRLVVAGGFLVPGKKGHISSLDYKAYRAGEPVDWEQIASSSDGFFHRVQSINVLNRAAKKGDSGERFVTCVGRKSVFNGGGGEMVFLEPSQSGELKLHKIADGCDCFFAPIDLNGDGITEFVVPAFFGKKVLLVWTEHPEGDYSQAEFVRTRVIDDLSGAAFDVQVIDLNQDGTADIMISNHQDGKKGIMPSVFAYRVQAPAAQNQDEMLTFQSDGAAAYAQDGQSKIGKFMNALQFQRHTLASNFSVINRSFNSAAPGAAQAIFPYERNGKTSKHPVIVVSGDGSEKAYLMTPTDLKQDRWQYRTEIFHDCSGTVGGITVADVDNDGWKEVFVPCYDRDYVAVYRFKA